MFHNDSTLSWMDYARSIDARHYYTIAKYSMTMTFVATKPSIDMNWSWTKVKYEFFSKEILLFSLIIIIWNSSWSQRQWNFTKALVVHSRLAKSFQKVKPYRKFTQSDEAEINLFINLSEWWMLMNFSIYTWMVHSSKLCRLLSTRLSIIQRSLE